MTFAEKLAPAAGLRMYCAHVYQYLFGKALFLPSKCILFKLYGEFFSNETNKKIYCTVVKSMTPSKHVFQT
jgi:hypothetical protein